MVIIQHPGEPNPNEPKRYSRMTEMGRGRGRCTGYLSYSDRIGPGVLVLHEFFGLTGAFRAYCDALAAEGFTALAIDLYDGRVATTVEEAEALADSLDPDIVGRRLDVAAEHLVANWHPRLGVVGFSLGAFYAAQLASRAQLEASVHYYAAMDIDPATFSGPLLSHVAEVDEWDPLRDGRARIQALERSGLEVDAHVYPGTGHWFANADVPGPFNDDAASLALARTIDFLRHHLA